MMLSDEFISLHSPLRIREMVFNKPITLIFAAVCIMLAAVPAGASYSSRTEALLQYLSAIQLADGAIADTDGRNAHTIDPGKSVFADMGLALANDPAPALANLQWYVSKMLPPGVYGGREYAGCPMPIWEFKTSPFEESATQPPWNTDTVGANFLTAMALLYQTGDAASQTWIATQEANAECVAASQQGTYQPAYHLTTNYPGYPAMEAEDNFDGWRGMGSIAWLEANAWGNSKMAATYSADQANLGVGLASLWDTKTGLYDIRIKVRRGTHTEADCSRFTPDCLMQLWPVTDGFASPADTKSISLWRRFRVSWPGAAYAPPPERDADPRSALAAAMMGDQAFLERFTNCLNAYEAAQGYRFPAWFSNDGGQMLAALSIRTQRRMVPIFDGPVTGIGNRTTRGMTLRGEALRGRSLRESSFADDDRFHEDVCRTNR
jgi:hypothetical protein